jgi:hypothetical protein
MTGEWLLKIYTTSEYDEMGAKIGAYQCLGLKK